MDHRTDLAPCPFCGEAYAFIGRDDEECGGPFIGCGICHARGPVAPGDFDKQTPAAIALWNRRLRRVPIPARVPGHPTDAEIWSAALDSVNQDSPDSIPIGVFDEMDGTWSGKDDLRVVWLHRGIVDGLLTARRVAEENGSLATAEALQKSIDHHQTMLAQRLAIAGPVDELMSARIRREGLPSIDTTTTPDGVAMEFDLGGEPKK